MIAGVHDLIVPPHQSKTRLDKFLAGILPKITRSQLQHLIKNGEITVDGSPAKASHIVQPGETVRVNIPPPPPSEVVPERIPLHIVYEDEYLVVVDKPAGLVVHPAYGHPSGTLANALVYYFEKLSRSGGSLRPGIVHRLDKDTSGLLVAARDEYCHATLSNQFKEKSTEREYLAVVWGIPVPASDTISSFLVRSDKDRRKIMVSDSRGKWAVTHYEVVESFRLFSLLRLRLETGRTHQIRVHLSHRGHPVFGDPTYAGRKNQIQGLNIADTRFVVDLLNQFRRQALHARTLGFIHPVTGEKLHFESPLPEDMRELIQKLRRN